MSPEEVVYRALSGNAGIAAIVGTRISPMHSIELGELPCITYSMIGTRPECTQEGPQNMQDPAVQIDCWARLDDYDGLKTLRQAVLDCLYASDSPGWCYFFVTIDGTDMNEPESRIARKMIQADVWHNVNVL